LANASDPAIRPKDTTVITSDRHPQNRATAGRCTAVGLIVVAIVTFFVALVDRQAIALMDAVATAPGAPIRRLGAPIPQSGGAGILDGADDEAWIGHWPRIITVAR
tara:strand:- start:262 stop:579 length:318 start_codon:yes stop_codon:yes gene_type:complete